MGEMKSKTLCLIHADNIVLYCFFVLENSVEVGCERICEADTNIERNARALKKGIWVSDMSDLSAR